jgi:hypothetical protein
VWLWWSGVDATPAQVDLLWQAFLRRFDIEHTFRLLKQTLGHPQTVCRGVWSGPMFAGATLRIVFGYLLILALRAIRCAALVRDPVMAATNCCYDPVRAEGLARTRNPSDRAVEARRLAARW